MLRRMLQVGSMFAAVAILGVSTGWAADENKAPAKGEGRPGASPEQRAEFLKKFDKNGDGKLDDAEKAEAMKNRPAGGKPGEGRPLNPELIKRLDKNGDGKLDDAEKAEAMKNRPAGGKPGEGRLNPEMLKKFDKDGDGKLSDSEREAARAEIGKNRPAGDQPKKRPEDATPPAKKPEAK